MGVAALVLGILGIVMAIIPTLGVTQMIGVVLGILALILGIIARKKAVEEQQGKGVATAGLVLGIVAMVFSALLFAACQYCQHKVKQTMESPEFKDKLRKSWQEGLRKARKQAGDLQRKRKAGEDPSGF